MTTAEQDVESPRILQWFLDTRPLWQVTPSKTKKDEVEQLKTVASRELGLLTPDEQTSVLKFYHLRDAKLSLASHLLKHFVIAKYCSVPWSESIISRDAKGKPCYVPLKSGGKNIEFNVSHQAGIVSLIAAVGFSEKIDVGTDVVCWNERKLHDDKHIEQNGFFDWIEMHADVFARSEVYWMKSGKLQLDIDGEIGCIDPRSPVERRGGSIEVRFENHGASSLVKVDRNTIIDANLRRFYAMWCLREAYVKMTGEALLASWLQKLDIQDVQSPTPKKGLEGGDLGAGECRVVTNIVLDGTAVKDVNLEITAIGEDYMIAACIRPPPKTGHQIESAQKWQQLKLEDILP